MVELAHTNRHLNNRECGFVGYACVSIMQLSPPGMRQPLASYAQSWADWNLASVLSSLLLSFSTRCRITFQKELKKKEEEESRW